MIYVDFPIWHYRNVPMIGFWGCMATDEIDNLEALHLFAESLGLKRAYFQLKYGRTPHYDLYEGRTLGHGKYTDALKKGAKLESSLKIARLCWLDANSKPYRFDPDTHKRIIPNPAVMCATCGKELTPATMFEYNHAFYCTSCLPLHNKHQQW